MSQAALIRKSGAELLSQAAANASRLRSRYRASRVYLKAMTHSSEKGKPAAREGG